MTVGAASGLNVILKTVLNPGDEVIVFAPYFLEYGAYVRNYDGVLVEISPDTETFQPNLTELEEKILRIIQLELYTQRKPLKSFLLFWKRNRKSSEVLFI